MGGMNFIKLFPIGLLGSTLAYAADAPANVAQRPGITDFILPMVATLAVFYMFILKPQQKERDRVEKLKQIEKGDEVITKGGLIGKVTNIAEKILTLEIAEQTRVKIDREFVHAVNKAK